MKINCELHGLNNTLPVGRDALQCIRCYRAQTVGQRIKTIAGPVIEITHVTDSGAVFYKVIPEAG